MRLKQEFEATVTRLQDEKANAADALAASRLQQTELLSQTQEKWKSQLDKIQEDTIKTKAKFNDLVFKNTALREKLASFSAYRDQVCTVVGASGLWPMVLIVFMVWLV
jgi:hypothetical protein